MKVRRRLSASQRQRRKFFLFRKAQFQTRSRRVTSVEGHPIKKRRSSDANGGIMVKAIQILTIIALILFIACCSVWIAERGIAYHDKKLRERIISEETQKMKEENERAEKAVGRFLEITGRYPRCAGTRIRDASNHSRRRKGSI